MLCLYSPYAKVFPIFRLELSLDNMSWIEIPHLSRPSPSDDYTQFADLGLVAIDKQILKTISGRYFISE